MTQPDAGLGPGRPSRTSIMVAANRAFGARETDPSVRSPDHLAERLLGPAERELIREHPIAAALEGDYQQGRQDMQVATTPNLMLVRTRFIDEHLLRALERGATQVVILGAGFDTRGYRFQDQLRGKRLFEVDHHGTQEFKKRRVAEVLGSPRIMSPTWKSTSRRINLRMRCTRQGTSRAPKRFSFGKGCVCT